MLFTVRGARVPVLPAAVRGDVLRREAGAALGAAARAPAHRARLQHRRPPVTLDHRPIDPNMALYFCRNTTWLKMRFVDY